jgi:hypothetical protein
MPSGILAYRLERVCSREVGSRREEGSERTGKCEP